MTWKMPSIHHLIPAEEFRWDFTTRSFPLKNVFVKRRPAANRLFLPRLDVVAVVGGGLGTFDFSLELARLGPDEFQVFVTQARGQDFTDVADLYTLPFLHESVSLDAPGEYELRLFARLVTGTDGVPVPGRPADELGTALMRLEVM